MNPLKTSLRSAAALLLLPLSIPAGIAIVDHGAGASGSPELVRYSDARLKIEVNATDGDAGLQLFADAEAWRRFQLFRPDGIRIIDLRTQSDLQDYGLTELFSESSEPPFEEFPLEQFLALFPEGRYPFRGETIDGKQLRGSAVLSHAIPDGPHIAWPRAESTVPRDDLVVRWRGVPETNGVRIAGYQVLVVQDSPRVTPSTPQNPTLSVDLPADARRLEVPEEFLRRHTDYKVEVLAVEAGGNQTLTEVPFTTR